MSQPNSHVVRQRINPADRAEVIDVINRLNLAFDRYDVAAMVDAFTEDCVVEHPYGGVEGHDDLRRFYATYRSLIPGVRRHNANHVVDADPDGTLTVTSFGVLIRTAPDRDAPPLGLVEISARDDGLPAIFSHALTIDRLRVDGEHGWRIEYRRVEDTTANTALRPTRDGRG